MSDSLLFQNLIYSRFKDSLIPELFAVFGADTLAEFMNTFGGKTITVPNFEELQVLLEDVIIFSQLDRRAVSVEDLAVQFDTTPRDIKLRFRRVSEEQRFFLESVPSLDL